MNRLMNRERIGKRKELVDKFDYDVKDASHIVRLMMELKDILFRGTFEMDRYSDEIRAIRDGEWSKERVVQTFELYMALFESDSKSFVVPYSPNEDQIKMVLLQCLEEKFGNLSNIGFNFNYACE